MTLPFLHHAARLMSINDMLIVCSFLEILDTILQESHKSILVEIVGTRLHQQVAVVVHQAVVRLSIGAELGNLEVGVFATDGLLLLAVISGGVPFVFRQ